MSETVETIEIADHNLQFIRMLTQKKEQLLLTHSRVRQQFLHTEIEILGGVHKIGQEVESFFNSLADQHEIRDPQNWRISFADGQFIRVNGETDGSEETSVHEDDTEPDSSILDSNE